MLKLGGPLPFEKIETIEIGKNKRSATGLHKINRDTKGTRISINNSWKLSSLQSGQSESLE